jgi:hypothetical protein
MFGLPLPGLSAAAAQLLSALAGATVNIETGAKAMAAAAAINVLFMIDLICSLGNSGIE